MGEHAVAGIETGMIEADLLVRGDQLMRRFRAGVRRELATHLSAGHPVYSGGTGAEAGTLLVHLPDEGCYEYRVRDDGTREIMHARSR